MAVIDQQHHEVTMATLGYVDCCVQLLFNMQGRFNLLESGLNIFEVILLLKIGFFFMTLHLLLGGIIYSDTGFVKLKKKICNRVLCKFLQSFQNENSLKYFQTCLPEFDHMCSAVGRLEEAPAGLAAPRLGITLSGPQPSPWLRPFGCFSCSFLDP